MTDPKKADVEALLRLSFRAFLEMVFKTLHPEKEFQDNWHIEAICLALECVASGDVRRQMIHVPPRTLKSIIVSVAWPAFLLGHDPSLEIWVVSNNLDLATELANKFRKVVETDWYRDAFPTLSGAPAKDNERVFITEQGGKREAISVNGAVIGKGADLIIMDDPLDGSQVASQSVCGKVNSWIDNSLSNRLNDPAKSPMVLVMQRLSIHDPAAHLASQEHWNRLSLPAIAEEDMQVPIGQGELHAFERGDLLDPARLPRDVLAVQRAKMGEANFLAQYQQRPVPAGGGEIDISLFQRYDVLPKPFDVRFLSVDAASGSQSGSYSVIQAFQMTDERLYMMWSVRGYWSFPQLVKHVVQAEKHIDADFIAIEKAHSGLALLETLWDRYPLNVRRKLLQPVVPKLSKEDRMAKAMVLVADERVLLPKVAPWLDVLFPELTEFPGGTHDDQVDALSQGILFFNLLLKSRYNPHLDRNIKVLTRW
ncbi:terminase [Silicimonas algicola]|uniref:Putative phage terminase large subunit-like protein n=1 Tax=Silicimonas algicola TaxID=1826607 RepID=A0A316G483_9RHOB|nr:terminase [Silicimonas algicola]AZQ68637.1 terminase [Silicimonas algicola]PWK55638.1 putative phage terminase large subunit-like protein [Silicimonas algicola]